MYGYVIFTDIEKYSNLKDADLKIYYNKVIPVISEKLQFYKDAAVVWNTWGDAIVAVYEKAGDATNMALAYREVFKELDFDSFGIKKLVPRIAGNFGEFEMVFDKVSGNINIHGTLINLTARIEPVTLPGEIFVTKEFKDMTCSSYDKVNNVRFDDMGKVKLPKNAGDIQLYRLCKIAEEKIKPVGIVLFPELHYIPSFDNNPNDTVDQKTFNKSKQETKSIARTESVVVPAAKSLDSIKQKIYNKENNDAEKESNLIKNQRKNKGLPVDNPLYIAIFIVIFAIVINYLLELQFIKDIFNLAGYYINSASNWLSSATKTQPLIPKIMDVINPWIWLRGFILASFFAGLAVTIMQARITKNKNIFTLSLITGVCQLVVYAMLINKNFSITAFIGFILVILVSFAGFWLGLNYAVHLYREKVITFSLKDGPLKYI